MLPILDERSSCALLFSPAGQKPLSGKLIISSTRTEFPFLAEVDVPTRGEPNRCVVHTAETDEQKCSRRCTAAITHIVTGDASAAGPASVRKRGQYDGAAWSGSGRGPAHCGRDGGIGGCQLCEESVKLRRAEWTSNRQESGGMWITSYRLCLAKIKSACEINNIHRGRVTCYRYGIWARAEFWRSTAFSPKVKASAALCDEHSGGNDLEGEQTRRPEHKKCPQPRKTCREKSCSRNKARSRPNSYTGKADDTEEETGKCNLWDLPGYGTGHLGKDSQR
jgi:hypothetical protein